MLSQEPSAVRRRPLLTDLVIGDSPRWHDRRCFGRPTGVAGAIVAGKLGHTAKVVAEGPPGSAARSIGCPRIACW
jgi:hypothetical protein